MKQYQITLDGRTFDVRVLSDPRQEQVQVEVNGQAFTVEVRSTPMAANAKVSSPMTIPQAVGGFTTSSRIVTAPLPGLIKSIAVRAGQRVTIGEELLVIEAMKMDNVVRAGREGVIAAVYTTEGDRVAYGERLLEYRESGSHLDESRADPMTGLTIA